MESSDLVQRATEAEAFLKAVGHRDRLTVLCALREGERSVNDLAEELNLGQAALSQHLARLRLERLVQTRREGQRIVYSLSDPRVEKLIGALYECFCAEDCGTEQSTGDKND